MIHLLDALYRLFKIMRKKIDDPRRALLELGDGDCGGDGDGDGDWDGGGDVDISVDFDGDDGCDVDGCRLVMMVALFNLKVMVMLVVIW